MVFPRYIGITDLRKNVRRVFDCLAKDREPVVVIRESKPEAVILPYRDYETLVNGRRWSADAPAEPTPHP